jgi:hypothetical protein
MALPLEQAKNARNAAHAAFRTQLVQVQEDLAARGIGGRIADRASEALAEAADVASEHKGVVAGTIAALAAWFLRGPIIESLSRLWTDGDDDEERNAEDD